jgi:hypothetical protein
MPSKMPNITGRRLRGKKWLGVYEIERTLMGDSMIAQFELAGFEVESMCYDHCANGERMWWVRWLPVEADVDWALVNSRDFMALPAV